MSLSLRSHALRWVGRPLEVALPRVLAIVPREALARVAEWLDRGGVPSRCDVVVVLGGGSARRAEHAAALYEEWNPEIVVLFSQAKPKSLLEVGAKSSLEVLVRGGVPPRAIVHDSTVATTFDEARRLRELGAGRRMLLVTDWYHRRRAGLVMARALRGTGTHAAVCAAPDPRRDRWWRSGERSVDVLSECAALVAYAVLGRI